MTEPVLRVDQPGLGLSLQGPPRTGWRKFGVPAGGAMDREAARWANRLLQNPDDAPVLELLLQGARLTAVCDLWIAVTGADAGCADRAVWRAARLARGESLEFPRNRAGVWSYLAVEGGFAAPLWLGSASSHPRAGIGLLAEGAMLVRQRVQDRAEVAASISGRSVPGRERRNYLQPPPLRVWPAPQTGLFLRASREAFFTQTWTVSAQSDRVGYRLEGPALSTSLPELLSEPVRTGSIQIPPGGTPIVTMQDGPTVGGYPKLGLVDPADLPWLAQCRPGQLIRFKPATDDSGF